LTGTTSCPIVQICRTAPHPACSPIPEADGMSKTELVEWIAMILVIVLWWPMLFFDWAPAYYRYPLYVVSVVVLLAVFRARLRRLNEGFRVSETMMDARRRAEDAARGGKPSLDEKEPPDVTGQLPFMPGSPPENADDRPDEPGN